MRSARCSAVGTDSLQNKTLQLKLERNEESCDTANANPLSRFHLLSGLSLYALSQRPSSLRFAFSKFGSPSDCAKHLPYHRPSNTLRVESNPASKCLNVSRQVSSFFIEVSACATLSETVAADTPDAWILGSVAESLDRPHIHLLPQIL